MKAVLLLAEKITAAYYTNITNIILLLAYV